MSIDLAARLDAAVRVGREAGALCRRYFSERHTLEIESKGPQDYVSAADRAVESLILEGLGAAFPEDRFLAEESGGQPADRLWVVDPIDGTTNFLRGLPMFCVSIAFVDRGVTELGVIVDVMAGELHVARRGHGATRNGEPLSVSDRTGLEHALIALGYSERDPPQRYAKNIQAILAGGGELRRLGTAALSLAHVASGRLDGFAERQIASWDALAGLLLVAEAGGVIGDGFTGEGIFQRHLAFAATPGVAPALKAILAA
jgi:myo-inositol-1(or 4)-monophosphatase